MPRLRRIATLDRATLRAAAWALLQLCRTRRSLSRRGLGGAAVARPPALPASARRGVLAAVRLRPVTCLERALVLQRWDAAHGACTDIVIGVGAPGDEFCAHAWLDSMPDAPAGAFHEIVRLPAPAP